MQQNNMWINFMIYSLFFALNNELFTIWFKNVPIPSVPKILKSHESMLLAHTYENITLPQTSGGLLQGPPLERDPLWKKTPLWKETPHLLFCILLLWGAKSECAIVLKKSWCHNERNCNLTNGHRRRISLLFQLHVTCWRADSQIYNEFHQIKCEIRFKCCRHKYIPAH